MEDPDLQRSQPGLQASEGSSTSEAISSTDVDSASDEAGCNTNDKQQPPNPPCVDAADESKTVSRQTSNLSDGATSVQTDLTTDATSDVTSDFGSKKEKKKSVKYKTLINVFSKMKTGTVGKRGSTEVPSDLAERILRTRSRIERKSGKPLQEDGRSNGSATNALYSFDKFEPSSGTLRKKVSGETSGAGLTSERLHSQEGSPPEDVELPTLSKHSKRRAPRIPTWEMPGNSPREEVEDAADGAQVVRNVSKDTDSGGSACDVARGPLNGVAPTESERLPGVGPDQARADVSNELDPDVAVGELDSVINAHALSDDGPSLGHERGLPLLDGSVRRADVPAAQVLNSSQTHQQFSSQDENRSLKAVVRELGLKQERSEKRENVGGEEKVEVLHEGRHMLQNSSQSLDEKQPGKQDTEAEPTPEPNGLPTIKASFYLTDKSSAYPELSYFQPRIDYEKSQQCRNDEPERQQLQQEMPQQQQEMSQQQQQQQQEQPLFCCNHSSVPPQRYCSDHSQAICLECAFEFHRSCVEVEGLQQAAVARRKELQSLCDRMLCRKAELESLLGETQKHRAAMAEEKEKALSAIKRVSDELTRAIQKKGAELAREAEQLFASEHERWSQREEEVKRALSMTQEAYCASDEVAMTKDSNDGLLRQFGKLRDRCEAVMEIEISDVTDVLNRVEVKSKWAADVMSNDVMELNVEKSVPVKKPPPLSERSLETFRRISRKKRQALKSSTFEVANTKSLLPPSRSGQRASMARSLASTGSLASLTASTPSMSFLDGPQSMFEFWAGLGADKYPFGLGDMCILQPRATILITYLTSDILRAFPWRQESPPFVSQPLGFTLCSITQLTTEIVAVTSSNSDQLSFIKVENNAINLMHTISMKKQYRAVTSLDFRTLALATDHRKSQNNIIAIVRFDSSDFRSFTHLRTINGRTGSFPRLRLLSKTLFKVPYSMCVTNSGHLVVSDSENKALLCMDQSGQTHFLFQPPKHSGVIDTPGGVTCSPSGFLYMVDSCEQRILRINPRGRLLKVVLSQEDGLEWPVAVGSVDDSTLCVAEFYGQVKIFQIR